MVYPIAGDDSMYSPRWKAAVIVPKISSVISILASAYIVQSILRSNEKKTMTTHRIVVALSVSDILVSFTAYFLSTWPVPRGTIFGAVGNDASCFAQGAFNQALACFAMSYNGALALAYLLMARYHWNRNTLRRLEAYLLLLLPALACLFFTTPLLWDQAFGYRSINCYIGPTPAGCDDEDSLVECKKGLHFQALFILCTILPTFLLNVFIITCMVLLYKAVRKAENASIDYRFAQGGKSISKEVGIQGILYSCAYFLTWWPYYISGIMGVAGVEPPFIIDMLGALVLPGQGLFNALVYLRPSMTSRQQKIVKYAGIIIFVLGPIILSITLLTANDYQERYYKSSNSTEAEIIVEDTATARPLPATELPGPPSNLEQLCQEKTVNGDAAGNKACFKACEVAECCYFPEGFKASCVERNKEVCAVYEKFCDNLIRT